MKFISYGHQQISTEDIEAVIDVLKSDFLTQGPAISAFERAVCEQTGSIHAVACANGTAALHLACIAAGIGPGDRVIVPAVTFVASANCARFNGAEILFCDIDPETFTISTVHCNRLLEDAAIEGRPIKAVITVDLAGHPCDMLSLAFMKKKYGFIWIQDACHSIGGAWEDSAGIRWRVGEYPEVDMTVFSFHPVKHITTGEGGMIVTHVDEYADVMRRFRSHGIVKECDSFVNRCEAFSDGEPNPWYYEMQELGFNYRMTDLQAALGCSQIKRLDDFLIRRREIVAAYKVRLSGIPYISFPAVADGVDHAFHLAVFLMDFSALGKTRAMVMRELSARGIGSQVHYVPVPMMPYYSTHADVNIFPVSLSYYRRALSLPCFPSMSDDDVDRVCLAVKEIIK